jgi:hypothetical protein
MPLHVCHFERMREILAFSTLKRSLSGRDDKEWSRQYTSAGPRPSDLMPISNTKEEGFINTFALFRAFQFSQPALSAVEGCFRGCCWPSFCTPGSRSRTKKHVDKMSFADIFSKLLNSVSPFETLVGLVSPDTPFGTGLRKGGDSHNRGSRHS